jgi:hypothetical protein
MRNTTYKEGIRTANARLTQKAKKEPILQLLRSKQNPTGTQEAELKVKEEENGAFL